MPLVVTTENRDFKPLGARGDYVLEARERLRELGPDYVAMLAEPVSESGWGRTSWFNDGPIIARPAKSLDDIEAEALYGQLTAMRAQINKLADSIASPRGRAGGDKELAQALRRLAVVPSDEDFVWSVGGKPLLVAWSHIHINDSRPEETIIGEGLLPRKSWSLPQPEPDPVRPEPAPPAAAMPVRWPWYLLAWLLFIALVGAIDLLLVKACGIFVAPEGTVLGRFLPNSCHAEARPIDPSILSERADLERKIKEAELNLSRQVENCPPPAPPPPPPPSERQTQEMRQRLARERAGNGKLQISLKWDGLEDLDLHVKCPGGELNWQSPETSSGHQFCNGTLDVDMNFMRNSASPVESSYWPSPPAGNYEIYVNFAGRKDQAQRKIPFQILVRREGRPDKTFDSSVSQEGESVTVYSFTIP